jgi:hypothetical protein
MKDDDGYGRKFLLRYVFGSLIVGAAIAIAFQAIGRLVGLEVD